MGFSLRIAIRYFLAGGTQTWLTVSGVAFGVTVYLFITSLITGLQTGLIQRTIGSSSQITLEPLDEAARQLPIPNARNVGDVQPFTEREPRLRDYSALVPFLDQIDGVAAVSPVVSGPGFAIRGGTTRPITIIGIQEDRGTRIFDIRANLKEGALDLSGQGCAIGIELARLLGVGLRDKIRVRSGQDIEQTFIVQGIFDSGNINVNERSFYVSLPQGQRLNDFVGTVSRIEMKAVVPFEADQVAQRIAVATDYQVTNWKDENTELFAALEGQSSTTGIIRVFVMILVATSVAGVLIVTVLQRSREIGILRSMGASTGTIQQVFILLGFCTGGAGAVMGAGVGGVAVFLLSLIPGSNPFAEGRLFPIDFQLRFALEAVVIATLIGTLAAIAPARRGAKMNPVDIIRQG